MYVWIVITSSQFAPAALSKVARMRDPIRRISNDSIDLRQRRQDLQAIAQIQRRVADDLFTHQCVPALFMRARNSFSCEAKFSRICSPLSVINIGSDASVSWHMRVI